MPRIRGADRPVHTSCMHFCAEPHAFVHTQVVRAIFRATVPTVARHGSLLGLDSAIWPPTMLYTRAILEGFLAIGWARRVTDLTWTAATPARTAPPWPPPSKGKPPASLPKVSAPVATPLPMELAESPKCHPRWLGGGRNDRHNLPGRGAISGGWSHKNHTADYLASGQWLVADHPAFVAIILQM
jgi:hypothetical protein